MTGIYLFITFGEVASLIALTGDYINGTAFWQATNTTERNN